MNSKMETEMIAHKLDKALVEDFISVNKTKNPVLKRVRYLTFDQKLAVLGQYSIFPKNIISFLTAAAYSLSYYGWNHVVKELLQNINEEMGQGEGKISKYHEPHYTILRKIFKAGFDTDINNIKPHAGTQAFVSDMKSLLEDNNPNTVCGSVYALEASAVPELSLVKELVLSALDDCNQKLPDLLLDFFDWHINDIEIGHRDRLLGMASREITGERGWQEFEEGFRGTMSIMDIWWASLAEAHNVQDTNHFEPLHM